MGPVPFERYFQGLRKTTQPLFSMTSSKGLKLRLKVVKVSKFCVSAKWPYLSRHYVSYYFCFRMIQFLMIVRTYARLDNSKVGYPDLLL